MVSTVVIETFINFKKSCKKRKREADDHQVIIQKRHKCSFSEMEEILKNKIELTPEQKLRLRNFPFGLLDRSRLQQVVADVVMLLRRGSIKYLDLIGKDKAIRLPILFEIIKGNLIPRANSRSFFWYCFHSPRREICDLVDSYIPYRGNYGTTLMTCGIMAFQYWILNLSSKLQGANPFEMGLISTDAMIHSSSKNSLMMWTLSQKTIKKKIDLCFDYGLQIIDSDQEYFQLQIEMRDETITLSELVNQGYQRELYRQKCILNTLDPYMAKDIIETIIDFICLKDYFFNFQLHIMSGVP